MTNATIKERRQKLRIVHRHVQLFSPCFR